MRQKRIGKWGFFTAALSFLMLSALSLKPLFAATLVPPFDLDYTFDDLGPVPGLPNPYGGLTLKMGDPNTLLIGGSANFAPGMLYSIGVNRDDQGHITGFSGTATVFADAAYNDGGVTYGPGDVLFLARWPVNQLGQTKHGSTVTDKIINMAALGIGGGGPGGLTFVPPEFPGAGQLKLVTWPAGQFYTLGLSPDGSGTYDITSVRLETMISGGPEGFVYISPLNPQFTVNSMLVSEYSAGKVAVYEIDANGNPLPNTRREFITGLRGAEGAFIDPLTGDFLFSTWGTGADHVVAVRGFVPPQAFNTVRVIATVSTQGIELDQSSISKPPYSVQTSGGQTVIEWHYDTLPLNFTGDINFDVILKNPASGEQRLVTQKLELLYNDVNGNPVRTELGPQYVQVLKSAFDSTIAADKPVYQANEEVLIAANITNLSEYPRTIDAKVLIEDSNEILVKEVAALSNLNFTAGEAKNLGNLIFNTGSTLAGDFRVHLILYENLKQVGEAFADFKIAPTITLTSKVNTDKISYKANESVTIASQIQSISPN